MKFSLRLITLVALQSFSTLSHAETTPPRLQHGTVGDLQWEIIFTMPLCQHEGEAPTWCTRADDERANTEAGVLQRMLDMIRSPKTRHIYMASYSLSNALVVKAICEEANNRGLKAHVYVDKATFRNSQTAATLRTCSANVKVLPRGTGFGEGEKGYIQHAKMMMTTAHEEFLPLHKLAAERSAEEAASLGEGEATFVGTSANLSTVGLGLNYENWLFFKAPFRHRLAQQNICFFYAMEHMKTEADPDTERTSFANEYLTCQNSIAAPAFDAVEFYPVPHGGLFQQAAQALRTMIREAKTSIKVGVHRLSTASITKPLMQKAQEGLAVTTLFDDDTLRSGKCDGGSALQLSANVVATYRTMRDANLDIRLFLTNAGVPHMYHDKFVIVDDAQVFVGAGNFTAASLNSYNLGNFEQFYVLKDPEMVRAYTKAWDYYMTLAVPDEKHPIFLNTDRAIVPDPNAAHAGLLMYDETSCRLEQ